jgi:hypothetical protein
MKKIIINIAKYYGEIVLPSKSNLYIIYVIYHMMH